MDNSAINAFEWRISMKKSLFSLIAVFIILSICCYGIAKSFGTRQTSPSEHTLVSSFYPEYIISKNLVKGCDSINVKNMTPSASGCLHDYQLTSSDMKKLECTDAFIINGGGMETFLDDIKKAYPNIKIIDSSKNIKLLKNIENHSHKEHNDIEHNDIDHNDSKEHQNNNNENSITNKDHESEDEHEHEHGEYNAHMWLNPSNYIIQINNIKTELCKIYPEYKDTITNNSKAYTRKVNSLQKDITDLNKKLKKKKGKNAILFHDSFAYIADAFNINIISCIEIESDSSLSAGTIANTIDEIKLHDIKILLSEKQFKTTIADNIASETNAKVYVLDSLVTGDNSYDSYINGMNSNIKTIENIFNIK